MKRIGYIYEQIVSVENCREAILNASKHKKKRKKVQAILDNLDFYAQDLSRRLQELDFLSPYFVRTIKDGLSGKERELQIPAFWPDQCAHHALVQVIKPIILRSSYHWSCANIPKRGIDHAWKGVERATVRDLRHAKYCSKMDVSKFYPSIPHDVLKACLRRKIKDKKALVLFDMVIDSHYPGIPIGNYTSPWFAELMLQSLDYFIKQTQRVLHYIRFADDMVLIDNNKRKLHRAMDSVIGFVKKLGLNIKHDFQVFRIQRPAEEGERVGKGRRIDFVGRCFGRGFTTIRKRRALALMRQSRHIQKLQRQYKPVSFKMASGFLSRCSCFKHTNSYHMKQKYHDTVDIKALKEVIRNESKRKLLAQSADNRAVQSPPWVCGGATA